MLFLYFLAGLSAAPGWMFFWAALGFFFSSRPAISFVLPFLATLFCPPWVGVAIVAGTWISMALGVWPSSRTDATRRPVSTSPSAARA